jgi:Spy/CpxP family protein refolding chaperone
MFRFPGRVLWSIAALAVVVATAQVAEAQREGGRRGRGFGRGGFGLSTVRLATVEEVQDALKLTEDQKTKVEEINDQLNEDFRGLFRQGGGGREEMQKLSQEASTKLSDVLDEAQNKRLLGILAQVDVGSALNTPAIAKELNITDEQKTELDEVRDSNRQAMRDAFDEGLSREEMAAKMQELRTEGDKKLMAVLTSEQQTQYEALKGEPVEIDMSQFQFRGGRGFGGGRGGREGGGRGRDRGNDGGNTENNS